MPRPNDRSENADVVVISRQRLVGRTNGSSTYLLDICRSLKASGRTLRLVSPSPATFGRWPVLAYKPEMEVFSDIRQRGGIRFGRYMVATDPSIFLKLMVLVMSNVMQKLNIISKPLIRPAPYAVAVMEGDAERAYVKKHSRGAKSVIVDYAFLTPLLPFVDADGAKSVVIMHDMFSDRKSQFDRDGQSDSVAHLTRERELDLLGRADAIAAIQHTEADAIRAALPGRKVFTTPLAVDVVASAQPGTDDQLLFVGSNTAPNVLGLVWFFEQVWPTVRSLRPRAELTVVGNVSRALTAVPKGVKVLGVVDRLEPLYRDAGVVISPLTVGSGLKIKVIEALSQGKALVGTSVALQGVEQQLEGAVLAEDDPAAFAQRLVELLSSRERRVALGEAARLCALETFSAKKCYGELRDFLHVD